MNQASVVLIIRETNIPTFPVGFQREILTVTNRKFATLCLPGGTVDPGEDPMTTAVRELQEEISVSVQPSSLVYLGKSISKVEDLPDWEVSLFYARSIWGRPTHVENGTEIYWRTWKQFLEETIFRPYYERMLPFGVNPFTSTRFHGTS